MKPINSIFIMAMTALLLSGCLYKLDIQQGNEITPQMVDRLSIGMTKRQVERTIGLPLISDPFNKDRWDYFYSYKEGRSGKVERQSASLFFEGDKLVDIQSRFKIDQSTDGKTPEQLAKEAEQKRLEESIERQKEKSEPWWKFW